MSRVDLADPVAYHTYPKYFYDSCLQSQARTVVEMKLWSPRCIEAHRDAADCPHDVQAASTARRPRLEIDEPARPLVALAQAPSPAEYWSGHLSRLLAVVASRATCSRHSDLNCQYHPLAPSASLRGMNFDGVVRASLYFAMVKTTTTTMMMT
jgi:hypothetical protein